MIQIYNFLFQLQTLYKFLFQFCYTTDFCGTIHASVQRQKIVLLLYYTLRFCLLFMSVYFFLLLQLFVYFWCYECESLESPLAVLLLLLLLFFIPHYLLTLNIVLILLQNKIIGSPQLFVYLICLRMKKKIRGLILTRRQRETIFLHEK